MDPRFAVLNDEQLAFMREQIQNYRTGRTTEEDYDAPYFNAMKSYAMADGLRLEPPPPLSDQEAMSLLGEGFNPSAVVAAPVSAFGGMTDEQLQAMQAQTAYADALAQPMVETAAPARSSMTNQQVMALLNEGSQLDPMGTDPLVAPPLVPAKSRPAASAPVTRTTTRTRRSVSPASAGKTMVDFRDELDRQILKAEQDLLKADRDLLRYDAESQQFPGESKDLALMRALSDQLREEGGRSYSNIAAQLAMVQDANFAPVFDREVNRRVNAARKFFGRAGQIQRAAQGERAAFRQSRARSRRRSEERMKAIRDKLKELQKAKYRISLAEFQGNTAPEKRRRAAMMAANRVSMQAGKPGRPLDVVIKDLRSQVQKLQGIKQKLTDPKGQIQQGFYERIARDLGQSTAFGSKDEALAFINSQLPYVIADLRRHEAEFRRGATYTPRVIADPAALRQAGLDDTPAASSGDAAGDLYGEKK